MSQFNVDLENLYQNLHNNETINISDFPAKPSPLRYFDVGGIPSEVAVDPDPKSRCNRCELRGVCENSNYELILPSEKRLEKFSHAWPITSMAEIKTRHTVIGEVRELNGPTLKSDGSIDLTFRLVDGYERAKVRTHRQGGLKNVSRSIQNDARRLHRALMLLDYVEKIAKQKGKTAITCRVAIDLESNKFWSACGYNIQATTISTFLNRKESKSKRPLHYYIKYINSLFNV